MSWPCFLIKSIRISDEGHVRRMLFTLPDDREGAGG
jgi:hypothetical protein